MDTVDDTGTEADAPMTRSVASAVSRREIVMVPSNVWRVGLVVLGLAALGLFLRFVVVDAGSVIFTVLMSWFAALAMAPMVDRLARRMRRGLATILVMGAFVAFAVIFVLAFGSLVVDQVTQLVVRIPDLIDAAIAWVNRTFSLNVSAESVLSSIGGGSTDFGALAADVGPSLFGILSSVLGTVFGLFTFGLFTFYFSADMQRLQTWMTRLFPARSRGVVAEVWRLTAVKTGGYVGARIVLGAINSVTTAIVFFLVGMPYWLPLAIWTGVVAQFVPTIGTYIAILLPVLVGFLSPNPWLGVIALAWGLLYQQVENLTIEPRISARAVDVNPAVAFGSVLVGSALFGIAGAFLAVPVTAMLLALLETYGTRAELPEPDGLSSGEDRTVVDAAAVPAADRPERAGAG